MQANQATRTRDEPSLPLYRRIHATLKDRIVSGRYEVDCPLPTEAKLSAEFKASRFTIREALRGLAEQGFVRRRPRSGTVVVTREPSTNYTQSVRSIEDLFQIAITTHYVMLATNEVILNGHIAASIGGKADETWIRIDGVRWDRPGGRPICYIESYVPIRHAAIVPEFAETKGPLYGLLERRSGERIEEVTQDISALVMSDEATRALGLASQSLSLRLLRRYTTKSGTLIASFNWHRADEFSYRMQLHRRTDMSIAAMPERSAS